MHELVARRVVGVHVLLTLLLLWLGLAAGQQPAHLLVTVGTAALLAATTTRLAACHRLTLPLPARSGPVDATPSSQTPHWRALDLPRHPARPRAPGRR